MRQCNRCGEHNHDDARYCGTCGLSMPTADGIESLVDDGSGPDDDTVPSPGPGADGLRSSEYVGAPTFGETGPVTGPSSAPPVVAGPTTAAPPAAVTAARASVPPSGGPPPADPQLPPGQPARGAPGPRPEPLVRSSRSASIMIAALVVAAVVIIGGVFILLASGSGGTQTARTGEAPVAPTAPPDTQAPVTVAPVPSDAPPTETPSAETSPAGTTAPVVEPPPSVTPQPTTVPPSPAAPTVPPAPAPTGPSRGPGDLGLTQPILDELCDGRYITFVGSAVGDQPYNSVVSELLDLYPGTNYIWTKACPSLRQEFSNGADIYGVVFGPYATQQEACNARAFGPNDAYVRRISTSDPQDHTIRC